MLGLDLVNKYEKAMKRYQIGKKNPSTGQFKMK